MEMLIKSKQIAFGFFLISLMLNLLFPSSISYYLNYLLENGFLLIFPRVHWCSSYMEVLSKFGDPFAQFDRKMSLILEGM